MAKSKVDWGKARQEYTATKNMSLKDVSVKYKISYSRVTKLAMVEKWSEAKKKAWGDAEKEALEETEGSIKDLIKRHSKVARYLQAGGLKNLKLILDEVEELMKDKDSEGARKVLKGLIYNKIISSSTLTSMISEGLKAERELYPKQMQIEADIGITAEGISEELTEAIYGTFRKRIGRKRPSIHKPVSKGKSSSKKK